MFAVTVVSISALLQRDLPLAHPPFEHQHSSLYGHCARTRTSSNRCINVLWFIPASFRRQSLCYGRTRGLPGAAVSVQHWPRLASIGCSPFVNCPPPFVSGVHALHRSKSTHYTRTQKSRAVYCTKAVIATDAVIRTSATWDARC